MNKMIKTVALSLTIASSAFMATAAQAEQKIAYVNTQHVFQSIPQHDVVAKKLQEEFKDKKAEVEKLQQIIQDKVTKLRRDGELMSEDERRQAQIELGSLQSELKIKGQSLEHDAKQRENAETQKLIALIEEAINKVAKEQGYDLVVDSKALLFAKPEFDLTDTVVKNLK